MFATCAVCTDLNEHGILELCNANVLRNKGSLKGEVIAAELNWTTFDGLELRDFPHRNEITHILRSVDIIIAADVVYSEDLTRSLLACVSKLVHLSNRTVDVYVAVEKRINFTLEAMEAASPAYDYFMSSITEQSEITGLFGRCEDTTPQQYFQYNRTPQLEIWHIEASPGNQVTT
jgi:predicted nicotinamide N-methyase